MSVRVVPFIGCRSLSFPLEAENIKLTDKVLGIVPDAPCITKTENLKLNGEDESRA